jgi:hypothetical protein
MAHDWSGLLGKVEAYSARGAPLLVDEDDEPRRRRASGIAMSNQPPTARFMPTGIAIRMLAKATPSSEPTISSVLQPPPSSEREVIALIGTLGSNRHRDQDEEWRRSAGGGGGGTGTALPKARLLADRRAKSDRSSTDITARAALAAGAQPVVIKVTSTVSTRASASGLMTYLGTREARQENGGKERVDIPIVDQDGVAITNRKDRAEVLAEWVSDFREGYAVNALATLSITLDGGIDDGELHEALNSTFGSKPFLYSRRPDGNVLVYSVTDLPAKKIAAALKARENGEGPARAVENAEADFARRLADAGVTAEVKILGAAVSEKSGRYFLEKFLRTEKSATTSTGEPAKHGSSIKEAADGIWRAWSGDIRSVEPRNAFHVIFSARAGTDPEAMKGAVRDFLSEQVAGHRWITAHHPETGHVHVHAMISARDDVGKALRFTKPELYEWRERFAVKAREHGIAMVATRRADVAATRPYSQGQAGAYERGRQDPRYLKSPSVTKRVEYKRAGVIDRTSLKNGNLALIPKWRATATALQKAGAKPSVVGAADRFAVAAAGRAAQVAPSRTKGFVLLRLEAENTVDLEAVAAVLQRVAGANGQSVSIDEKSIYVLAPTAASASKIERELAKQDDGSSPGEETLSVAKAMRTLLLEHGLVAAVAVEAAGSAKDGEPTPWLRSRFEAVAGRGATRAYQSLAELKTLVSDLKQKKENTMPLSLEQFDERVARANKSMDRLETMVDSSAERQAMEEMRREISALFSDQRRDIELQQMRSVAGTVGGGSVSSTARADDARVRDRAPPSKFDPAIARQQQTIAAGRAARGAREQADAAKSASEDNRQQILRDADQERQRDNGRDGAER